MSEQSSFTGDDDIDYTASSEERDRRARERARKEAAEARRIAEEAEMSDSDLFGGGPPPPRFSPVQIALGTVGFLFALMALIFKTADNDTLHAILSKVGLGHLVPKTKQEKKPICLDPKKSKWPPPPPPKPPCKPKKC